MSNLVDSLDFFIGDAHAPSAPTGYSCVILYSKAHCGERERERERTNWQYVTTYHAEF